MQSRPLLDMVRRREVRGHCQRCISGRRDRRRFGYAGTGPAGDWFGKCPVRRLLDGRMTIKYGISNALHLKWKRI